MKILAKDLLESISSKPSIEDLSNKLFQLGHEHEIKDGVFDMELTPNRGDCLSKNGLLRDLSVFYDIDFNHDAYYKGDIKPLDFTFINNAQEACPYISFLKIDIKDDIQPYMGELKNFFIQLNNNENNFFTDISNYISYETGQPTHCYDALKIHNNELTLETIDKEQEFHTLLDTKINLKGKNLVFKNGGKVINLAGIMGDKSTSCSSKTRSVIIECAFFNPEYIIGKAVKYDINSEAAHKFERSVDPCSHEKVLRRFIKIVQQHATIENIQFIKKDFKNFLNTKIPANFNAINKILGTNISENLLEDYLNRLGFKRISKDMIEVPSYRNDIYHLNDIAEEIARSIGYDNLPVDELNIPTSDRKEPLKKEIETNLKNKLSSHGFFEVVNNPFQNKASKGSIKVDNPLDSNRKFLRRDLKNSLLANLLYNERRQKDTIKLFEISDIYYYEKNIISKRVIGIIASGRVDRNYIDFSKQIDNNYLLNIIQDLNKDSYIIEEIPKKDLDSKIKNKIFYFETEMENFSKIKDLSIKDKHNLQKQPINFIKYKPISEYPVSIRDLSFSVKSPDKSVELEKLILNFSDQLLKDIFIFDFYVNEKKQQIKLGFRFVFQSEISTITDLQVNSVINVIINKALSLGSVEIPGYGNQFNN